MVYFSNSKIGFMKGEGFTMTFMGFYLFLFFHFLPQKILFIVK